MRQSLGEHEGFVRQIFRDINVWKYLPHNESDYPLVTRSIDPLVIGVESTMYHLPLTAQISQRRWYVTPSRPYNPLVVLGATYCYLLSMTYWDRPRYRQSCRDQYPARWTPYTAPLHAWECSIQESVTLKIMYVTELFFVIMYPWDYKEMSSSFLCD